MVLVVGLLIYAWRAGWPLWSASWYLYGTWVVVTIFGLLIEYLDLADSWRYTNTLLLIWLGVCILGYFRILMQDRLKGLLAVAFLFPFVGQASLEFIPNPFEGWLAIRLGFLAALAATAVVRLGQFRPALVIVLGVNALTGLLLAYTNEYQIKDLPSGVPAHIPQLSSFLGMLVLYLLIGAGIIGLPFLIQGLWRFGKRTLFS